jgi:hypothetical protein
MKKPSPERQCVVVVPIAEASSGLKAVPEIVDAISKVEERGKRLLFVPELKQGHNRASHPRDVAERHRCREECLFGIRSKDPFPEAYKVADESVLFGLRPALPSSALKLANDQAQVESWVFRCFSSRSEFQKSWGEILVVFDLSPRRERLERILIELLIGQLTQRPLRQGVPLVLIDTVVASWSVRS